MTNHGIRQSFDDDLRQVLAPRVRQTPLPAAVLRVPDRWVRQRPSLDQLVGRPIAIAAMVAAGVLLATQLPWLTALRQEPLTAASAASRVGMPARQVLATRDGMVAIRFSPNRSSVLEVLLISGDGTTGDVRVLSTASLDPSALREEVLSFKLFSLSCAPAAGLAQPDFLFGYTQYAGIFPETIDLNAASVGTWNDGLFLFALDPTATPAGTLTVTTQAAARPDLSASGDVLATKFDHLAGCRGQPVR